MVKNLNVQGGRQDVYEVNMLNKNGCEGFGDSNFAKQWTYGITHRLFAKIFVAIHLPFFNAGEEVYLHKCSNLTEY